MISVNIFYAEDLFLQLISLFKNVSADHIDIRQIIGSDRHVVSRSAKKIFVSLASRKDLRPLLQTAGVYSRSLLRIAQMLSLIHI